MLVGGSQTHAFQQAGAEGAGEAVACANGICHLHLGSLLEGLEVGGEHITAVHATREHQHVEVVLAQDEPAFVLHVESGVAKETADGHQLLVVNLQDIAATQAFADDLFGVEVLAKVDVEYLEAVFGRVVEELIDGIAALLALR